MGKTRTGGIIASATGRFGWKVRKNNSRPGTFSLSAARAGNASTVLPISENLMMRTRRGDGSRVPKKGRVRKRNTLSNQHNRSPAYRSKNRI